MNLQVWSVLPHHLGLKMLKSMWKEARGWVARWPPKHSCAKLYHLTSLCLYAWLISPSIFQLRNHIWMLMLPLVGLWVSKEKMATNRSQEAGSAKEEQFSYSELGSSSKGTWEVGQQRHHCPLEWSALEPSKMLVVISIICSYKYDIEPSHLWKYFVALRKGQFHIIPLETSIMHSMVTCSK